MGGEEEEVMEEIYQSKSYWSKRYENPEGFHEWYCDYAALEPLLEPLISSRDAMVLELGCGDAPLLVGLRDRRDHNAACLHALDFAATIIDKLEGEQAALAPGKRLVYRAADARKLPYADNTVDMIVEKGTVDAMLCGKRGSGFTNVRSILSEAFRVLKADVPTALVVVSHMQVESDDFALFLQKCVVPALGDSGAASAWTIEAHVQADTAAAHATVYIFKSRPRRTTRASQQPAAPSSIDVTVCTHGDVDDDDDEEG